MLKKHPLLYFIVFFTGMLSGLFSNAFSQGVPQLFCLSVNAAGSVNLTWSNAQISASNFNATFIYSSNSAAGPFNIVDSIFDYNRITYTHITSTANNGSVYYYLKTRYEGLSFSTPGDTLKTIFLSVLNSGDGIAKLNWNPLRNPLLSSGSPTYNIYREANNTWLNLDQTEDLNYKDTIALCSVLYDYRILNHNSNGCTSTSNIVGSSTLGTSFSDKTPPKIPVVDSVSVDLITEKATVSWFVNPSKDTKGFIVYKRTGGVWNIIETINNPTTTSYSYPLSVAGNEKESYRVAAFDSCNNISPMGDFHNTLFLSGILNKCKARTELFWNKYINWTAGVAKYQIWASKDNEDFFLLGEGGPSDTSYYHQNPDYGSTYCYIVRAIGVSGEQSSTSNKTCIFINTSKPPEFLYLANATVSDKDQIDLLFYADSLSEVVKYEILRSVSGAFVKVGTLNKSLKSTFTFLDEEVSTGQNSYYYKIQALDSCGNQLAVSNILRTILIKGKANTDLKNSISWNDFEGWKGNVIHYNIYRSLNDEFSADPFVVVNDDINSLTDDVISFKTAAGRFCYYIEAVENDSNAFRFAQVSRSNIECVIQLPKLYVPNAFSPNGDGLNDVFNPLSIFIDVNDYTLIIYDTKGQGIFESKNKELGWDGSMKGKTVATGVYAYFLSVKLPTGESFEKAGTITVLR